MYKIFNLLIVNIENLIIFSILIVILQYEKVVSI